jgi:hypothetical protein
MKTEQLIDCEGITLESNKPFAFSCCDCGLTHHMVIVSEDGKPVGFAVKRIELQVAEDTCQPARTMTVNVAAPVPAGVQGDAARLDFLDAMPGYKWMARQSTTGRGFRVHQCPDGLHKTARDAIDAAIAQSTKGA